MKRRYLCLGVGAFATGIIFLDYKTLVFGLLTVLFLLAGTLLLFKKKTCYLIMAILFLLGGFYGNHFNNKSSPLENFVQTPCDGEMYVTDIEGIGKDEIDVKATITKAGDYTLNEPVLFTIYGTDSINVNQRILFSDVKFKIPEQARNDDGFDYNRYLKSKGIYFTASADLNDLKAQGTDGFVILKFFRTLKQRFAQRCLKIWDGSYASGIIPAMLTGNRLYVAPEVSSLFSDAGMTHILVASGMHVVIVTAILAFLLFPLRKKRILYEALLATGIIAFALLVGYTPSIVRAVSSYFVYFAARKLLRSADPITILFEAMGIILIINPLSIYNLSLQLSFGAVFGILIFTPHIISRLSWFIYPPLLVYKLPKKISNIIQKCYRLIVSAAAVSISAQLGVFPFMMKAFGETSVFSLFINIIISFVVLFMCSTGLIASILNIEPFVTITRWLCNTFVYLAKFTTNIPGNKFQIPQSNIALLMITLFVIVCILRCKIPKFKPFFEPSAFLCVGIALTACALVSYIPGNKAEVTFLNVEQGDCSIIRLANNKTVMIDTGTASMTQYEVLPFLERKNIHKIDILFLSHSDNDHSGGLEILENSIEIDKIIVGETFKDPLGDSKHIVIKKGDKIAIGNADFDILYAPPTANNDNDSSTVMRMDFGESSVLFTGDISQKIEPFIENVDTDILKVSHHGAANASSADFLKRVSPDISVISVKKNNRYGHPDADTIKRLEYESAVVLRTDIDKTITIICDLDGTLKLTKKLKSIIINRQEVIV